MQRNYVTNVKIYKKKKTLQINFYLCNQKFGHTKTANLATWWMPDKTKIIDIFGWKLERQFLDLKIEYAFPVGSYGSHQGSTNKFY